MTESGLHYYTPHGMRKVTLDGNVDFSGQYDLAVTLSGTTAVTLPTSGTIATRAGSETLTNKTLTSPTINTPVVADGVTVGITASTTQTLAGGTALTTAVNVVATSANAGDAVTLPALAVGQRVTVFNNGANPIKVFPSVGTVAIDGGSAGASVTLTNAKRAVFLKTSATTVISYQLGVVSA
jgi:hypothetical protein